MLRIIFERHLITIMPHDCYLRYIVQPRFLHLVTAEVLNSSCNGYPGKERRTRSSFSTILRRIVELLGELMLDQRVFLSIKRLIINFNRNGRNISNSILSNSVENKVLVKYHNDLSLSFSTVHIKLKFVLSNKYIVRSKLLTRNMSRLIDELTELNTVIG